MSVKQLSAVVVSITLGVCSFTSQASNEAGHKWVTQPPSNQYWQTPDWSDNNAQRPAAAVRRRHIRRRHMHGSTRIHTAAGSGHGDGFDFTGFDIRPPAVDVSFYIGERFVFGVQMMTECAATARCIDTDALDAGTVERRGGRLVDIGL